MNTQHKFKTNELGITYNEWGNNLYKQLNLNYSKLNGTYYSTPKSTKGQQGSNNKNAKRL
jgi:hypothetical protein